MHAGVEVQRIAPIRSRAAYSQFVLKELGGHIQTDYALVVQWDGFVIDGSAWADEFWNRLHRRPLARMYGRVSRGQRRFFVALKNCSTRCAMTRSRSGGDDNEDNEDDLHPSSASCWKQVRHRLPG